MTPTDEPRQLSGVTLAAWAITILCVGLLWIVGYAGVYVCISFLGLSLFGGAFLMGKGLYEIGSSYRMIAVINLIMGLGTWAAGGVFVLQVLSNEEGRMPVAGRTHYIGYRGGIPPRKIRLLNLNVLHGYPDFEKQRDRFSDTVKELKRHDADIVVLQEAWITSKHGNMPEWLGAELGVNHAYARANGSHYHIGFEEGSAILSRFPIIEAERILLRPRRPWWEHRIALIAKVNVPDLGHVTVVGVHLSNSDAADDQAGYLIEILRDRSPDIIAGDFNSLPNARAMKAFVAGGFVEALPNNASAEPWIDHVFLSPAFHKRWEIKEASWIITTQAVPGVRDAISDHDGIVVELRRR